MALIKKDKPKSELKESMVQQMDVFLQSETNSFIEMLFKVVEAKEYLSAAEQAAESRTSIVKAELEAVEAKIEAVADSTTPVRDEKESKKKHKEDRRLAARLGPKETSSRRFRSRSQSRSLSPRYERIRVSRRRSRSPLYREMRRRSLEYILKRGRSYERGRRHGGSRSPSPAGYTPTVIAKKPRCKDYDGKGFCLRGDLCRYDHGMDAVVLEDAAKAVHAPPYVPGVPPTAGIPYPPPAIPVPPPGYPGAGVKRPFDGAGHEPPTKVGRGRGRGRGGGGRGGGSMLAVRNVPAAFNTITHLNAHFSRYGSLVNVQVQFEGDPSSALITFNSHEDASLAFNSSEAVMNNRFIKMFWHADKPAHVKNRLGGGGGHVNMHGGKISKTFSNDEVTEEVCSDTDHRF